MNKTLLIGGVILALLAATVVPSFAAGPPRGAGRGPGAGMMPGGAPGPGAQRVPGIPQDVHESIETAVRGAAARVLNMTPDDLNNALRGGKTMAVIAAEKNMPLATVRTAMTNARRFAINQALAAGKITREQANALLQAGPRFAQGRGAGMGRHPGMGPATGPGAGMGPGPGMPQHGPRR
jgi:hypothetical protein